MRKTSDIIWQDAQHQVLFEILDLIKQPGADVRVLQRLQDYTDNHFALEERYMELLDYPKRAEHVESHNRFRKEIGVLLRAEEHDEMFMKLISRFLTEWLTRHVFGIDKELEEFLLNSEFK